MDNANSPTPASLTCGRAITAVGLAAADPVALTAADPPRHALVARGTAGARVYGPVDDCGDRRRYRLGDRR